MFLRKQEIVAKRLRSIFINEKTPHRLRKEFYPSKQVRLLFNALGNSLTPKDFKRILGHYNLRSSLEKIAALSIDLFWNNAPDNPNRVNPSLKIDPNLEVQYHQYGLAFATHMLLTSEANDHKKDALTWADCVYLCALYDEKLYMGELNSIDDLNAWMTRLHFARFKHDLQVFDRGLARNLIFLVDIFPTIDNSEVLIDEFCNKNGFKLLEYFVYCFAIMSTIKETKGIIKDKLTLTGDIGENLNHKILHTLIDELTINYEDFKQLDEEMNSNEEIVNNFHETLFNPLIKKPLIRPDRRSRYRILPNFSFLSQALTQGLIWKLRDFSPDFQSKFFGKIFEQYFKKIIQLVFPDASIVDEFEYKPGAKFYDYSLILEDKIYFFEIKSKTTYLKFNQTGSFEHAFKDRETKEINRQISKIELLCNDQYSDIFKEKLGHNFNDKDHIPVFVFDIDLISNKDFRDNYVGHDISNNPNYAKTIFISMNDIEELYLTKLSGTNLTIERIYEEISPQPGDPKSFFKGVLSTYFADGDYLSDNLFKKRVDEFIKYIGDKYRAKTTTSS